MVTSTARVLLVTSFTRKALARFDATDHRVLQAVLGHYAKIDSALVMIANKNVLVAGRSADSSRRPATHFTWDGTDLVCLGEAIIALSEDEIAWKPIATEQSNSLM
jgi:hypothetical protein